MRVSCVPTCGFSGFGMPPELLVPKFFATVFLLISFIFFMLYFFRDKGSTNHVYLNVIGHHVIWATSTLYYYDLSPKPYVSVVLFFAGFFCSAVGTAFVLIEGAYDNNIHSWFGLLSMILSGFTWLAGTYFYFTAAAVTTSFVFQLMAAITLLMATVALVSGMTMDIGYKNWANVCTYVTHITMVVLYCLLTIYSVMFILYLGVDFVGISACMC